MKIIFRILEVIIYGALIEIIVSFILCYFLSESSVIAHLNGVYEANNQYLDSGYFVSTNLFAPISNYIITPTTSWIHAVAETFSNSRGLMHVLGGFISDALNTMGYALGVFLQKVLIALISVPVFAVFVLVGTYDGLIQRELRRYRVGIESTKRERFDRGVKWTTRCAFVGYVSIPLYIPAPLWFMAWGIATAILMQMTMSFVQKYI